MRLIIARVDIEIPGVMEHSGTLEVEPRRVCSGHSHQCIFRRDTEAFAEKHFAASLSIPHDCLRSKRPVGEPSREEPVRAKIWRLVAEVGPLARRDYLSPLPRSAFACRISSSRSAIRFSMP